MKKEFAKWMGLMLIICQLTIPAYAGTSFPDVPDAAPYAEAVGLMKEYGIFNGDANGNFNPSSGITRAEFAAVVCRAVGEESEISQKVEAAFADVSSNHWAAGYINWGVRRGILNGYGQGVFGLQDKVTYEQAIKVIVSVMGFENDAKELGGYPGGYITVAKRQGYLDGVNGKTGAAITRANIAVLLSHIISDRSDNQKAENTSEFPLTCEQVIEALDTYFEKIGYQDEGNTVQKYWNARYSTDALMEQVALGDNTSCLTNMPCVTGDRTSHNKKEAIGCKSNHFSGIHTAGGSQCAGFADYLEYILFKKDSRQYSSDNNPWFTKIETKDAIEEHIFKPGDLIRVNSKGTGIHSMVVYTADPSTGYLRFAECNYGGACMIRNDRIESVRNIKAECVFIMTPTAELRVDGDCDYSAANKLTVPSAPSLLATKKAEDDSATISWTPVNGAAFYEIQYRRSGISWRTDADYKAKTATSYISTGLADYDSYDYRVRAVNAAGYSSWSEITYMKPVKKECKHQFDNKGVCSLCGETYSLTLTTEGFQAKTIKDINLKLLPYAAQKTTRRLAKNTTVTITASTVNHYGSAWYKTAEGDWLFSDDVIKQNDEPAHTVSAPAMPANFKVTAAENYTATVSWSAVSGATSYEVQYKRAGIDWRTDGDYKTKTSTSYISTGLADYDSYDYRVRAVNAAGYSPWSEFTYTKPMKKECEHRFDDKGVCSLCGKSYSLTLTNEAFQAKILKDINLKTLPYAAQTTTRRLAKDTVVAIIASAVNHYNNKWYKTADGDWLYSEDVTPSVPAYQMWKNSDSRWSSVSLGGGATIGGSGGLVVSLAIAMADCGATSESYTPADLVTSLKAVGGLTSSGSLVWDKVSSAVPGFEEQTNVNMKSSSLLVAQKVEMIRQVVDKGYQVIVQIPKSSPWGLRYVAVDRVENGTVYMFDPNGSRTDLFATYGNYPNVAVPYAY